MPISSAEAKSSLPPNPVHITTICLHICKLLESRTRVSEYQSPRFPGRTRPKPMDFQASVLVNQTDKILCCGPCVLAEQSSQYAPRQNKRIRTFLTVISAMKKLTQVLERDQLRATLARLRKAFESRNLWAKAWMMHRSYPWENLGKDHSTQKSSSVKKSLRHKELSIFKGQSQVVY